MSGKKDNTCKNIVKILLIVLVIALGTIWFLMPHQICRTEEKIDFFEVTYYDCGCETYPSNVDIRCEHDLEIVHDWFLDRTFISTGNL